MTRQRNGIPVQMVNKNKNNNSQSKTKTKTKTKTAKRKRKGLRVSIPFAKYSGGEAY
jgi:hypothetical protein